MSKQSLHPVACQLATLLLEEQLGPVCKVRLVAVAISGAGCAFELEELCLIAARL